MFTTLRISVAILCLGAMPVYVKADDRCTYKAFTLQSKHLAEEREIWVSLPMRFDPSESYPVLYVLDAEWRFDLVRTIAWDLSGNKKIPRHIVIGIPHVEWENKRGIDLTFSHTLNEYDGSTISDGVYNPSNSGGGQAFFDYLSKEVVPWIDLHYPTNGSNVLIGHSYGGYFAAYALSIGSPFNALQIYDPSAWFNKGEVVNRLQSHIDKLDSASVFVSYQPSPQYHREKIDALISVLKRRTDISIDAKLYPQETHNSLFLPSFLDGMAFLYADTTSTEQDGLNH